MSWSCCRVYVEACKQCAFCPVNARLAGGHWQVTGGIWWASICQQTLSSPSPCAICRHSPIRHRHTHFYLWQKTISCLYLPCERPADQLSCFASFTGPRWNCFTCLGLTQPTPWPVRREASYPPHPFASTGASHLSRRGSAKAARVPSVAAQLHNCTSQVDILRPAISFDRLQLAQLLRLQPHRHYKPPSSVAGSKRKRTYTIEQAISLLRVRKEIIYRLQRQSS